MTDCPFKTLSSLYFLQPFKKVLALHLAGVIAQATGSQSMLESGIDAFSEAVHTLCDVMDISHAGLLLRHASDMLDMFDPSGATKVQFLLAKSGYLLVTGKVNKSIYLVCHK